MYVSQRTGDVQEDRIMPKILKKSRWKTKF